MNLGAGCVVDGEVLAVRVSGRLAVELERGPISIGGARREKCQKSRSDPKPAVSPWVAFAITRSREVVTAGTARQKRLACRCSSLTVLSTQNSETISSCHKYARRVG